MGYLAKPRAVALRVVNGACRALALAIFLLSIPVACSGRSAAVAGAPGPESILWGGGKCSDEADCPSRLCTMGMCLGYLAASTEEARDTVAPALQAVARSAGPGVVDALLVGILSDRSLDSYVRGRAADAFRHLPSRDVIAALPPFLVDVDEPVRFYSARAMASAGDARGHDALEAFRDHPAEAVRSLALRALERTD